MVHTKDISSSVLLKKQNSSERSITDVSYILHIEKSCVILLIFTAHNHSFHLFNCIRSFLILSVQSVLRSSSLRHESDNGKFGARKTSKQLKGGEIPVCLLRCKKPEELTSGLTCLAKSRQLLCVAYKLLRDKQHLHLSALR